jgi:alpha-1,2-mannosyltransferase
MPFEGSSELVKIISSGQFRPEKDHALQIRAMFSLRQIITEEEWEKVKMIKRFE